jgi:hypothetical protein
MYVCMYVLIEQLQRAVSQQKSKACTDSEAGINSGLQIWHSFLKISICWPGENNAPFLLLLCAIFLLEMLLTHTQG